MGEHRVDSAYGATGVTNETRPIFLEKGKWVRFIVTNAGPMVHPFHIHGYSTYYLGSYRMFPHEDNVTSGKTAKGSPIRSWDHPCTSGCGAVINPTPEQNTCIPELEHRFPLMLTNFTQDPRCAKTAAPYMNMFGPELIPPTHQRVGPLHGVKGISGQGDKDWDSTNPAMRDMVLAPPHSWSVFQFYTDNPGAWFFHCHLELHAGFGMAIALMVGAQEEVSLEHSWLNARATPAEIFENGRKG